MEGKFTEKSLLFDRVRGDDRNFMEDGFGAVEMNCGRTMPQIISNRIRLLQRKRIAGFAVRTEVSAARWK